MRSRGAYGPRARGDGGSFQHIFLRLCVERRGCRHEPRERSTQGREIDLFYPTSIQRESFLTRLIGQSPAGARRAGFPSVL